MSTCIEYRLGGNAGDHALDPATPPTNGRKEGEQSGRPNVLIYRNELIERSETFILAQAAAMRRHRGVFCGLTRKADGILPEHAACSLFMPEYPSGKFAASLRKRAYMIAGLAPLWRKNCRTFDPVLMHAHFAIDAAFALPLMRALKVPLIVSLHGYDVTRSDKSLRNSAGGRLHLRRRQQLFERAALFVCVSNFIRDQAIERGYPPRKLWVHSIGIDVNTFRNDNSIQRKPVVLFVGRLVEKKGCAHLIGAMRTVQEAMPGTSLVLIGDGPLRQKLEEQAANSLPGEYTFLGAQPAGIVHSWLQQAMVFCVPSVAASNGDREGLGMVFCEAQAMGVPVVSSASGGIPEAVVDGVTGFLAPEHDENGLAQAICKLLQDRECWAEMSRQGQQRVRQHYNLALQTSILEAQYAHVIASTPRSEQVLRRT